MRRAWDVQIASNWWLSLGFHIDHTDPSLTLHLPGVIVYAGRCKQPGFRPVAISDRSAATRATRATVQSGSTHAGGGS